MTDPIETVDDYIDSAPADVQPILGELRETIRRLAPEAEESMSYNIPTYKVGGRRLIYFAAWKNHIALYPIPRLEPGLEGEVAPLRSGKDTVRLPLDRPIPYDLVGRIVTAMTARS